MSQTKTKIVQPIPYLHFHGNCKEAMSFYANVLGGKVVRIYTYGDSPFADQFPDTADKVMNAQVDLPGGMTLFGTDTPPGMGSGEMNGFNVCLAFDTAEEGSEIFKQLSEGGTITMPYEPSFWAKGFGMLTDKFGTPWMVNGELIPMD